MILLAWTCEARCSGVRPVARVGRPRSGDCSFGRLRVYRHRCTMGLPRRSKSSTISKTRNLKLRSPRDECARPDPRGTPAAVHPRPPECNTNSNTTTKNNNHNTNNATNDDDNTHTHIDDNDNNTAPPRAPLGRLPPAPRRALARRRERARVARTPAPPKNEAPGPGHSELHTIVRAYDDRA